MVNFNKTPLGETGCLGNPYFLLTGCLGIQFFDSLLYHHSQLGHLSLATPHCAPLVRLTRHHAMPLVTKCFPPTLPTKAEHFPRGGSHSKHVPLLTYLA